MHKISLSFFHTRWCALYDRIYNVVLGHHASSSSATTSFPKVSYGWNLFEFWYNFQDDNRKEELQARGIIVYIMIPPPVSLGLTPFLTGGILYYHTSARRIRTWGEVPMERQSSNKMGCWTRRYFHRRHYIPETSMDPSGWVGVLCSSKTQNNGGCWGCQRAKEGSRLASSRTGGDMPCIGGLWLSYCSMQSMCCEQGELDRE